MAQNHLHLREDSSNLSLNSIISLLKAQLSRSKLKFIIPTSIRLDKSAPTCSKLGTNGRLQKSWRRLWRRLSHYSLRPTYKHLWMETQPTIIRTEHGLPRPNNLLKNTPNDLPDWICTHYHAILIIHQWQLFRAINSPSNCKTFLRQNFGLKKLKNKSSYAIWTAI